MMKLLKISALLLAGAVATSTAYAQNYLAQTNAPSNVVIHKMNVTNSGDRYVNSTATISVGHVQGNTCVMDRTLAPAAFTFGPHSVIPLVLYGDNLAQNIGLHYSCMNIALATDKQTTNDAFRLYNNGTIYSGTDPNYDEVTIN